jgi:hypothetical protein
MSNFSVEQLGAALTGDLHLHAYCGIPASLFATRSSGNAGIFPGTACCLFRPAFRWPGRWGILTGKKQATVAEERSARGSPHPSLEAVGLYSGE